ncbi:Leucine-rich repeat and calponin-likey domain-containing protein 3 [Ophiophagus hannah]|uniref:Leucine-rich repeat and calponin-likey domain-containing protein 3 n=1 Tax=Ophiophagus hannah TaxID=8665 RepID=V8NDI6_OPHHA|nr:Leucine-rich repeat and calponin-likey domain-containing protein 3 [Ophiophagus hannah]
MEWTRREAQLAALHYEEEKRKTKQIQKEAVLDFVKLKASQSPRKQNTLENECPFPSRRSQHTDDSALLVSTCLPHILAQLPPLRTEQLPSAPKASFSEMPPEKKQAKPSRRCLLLRQLRLIAQTTSAITIIPPCRKKMFCAALTDGVVLCHLANHVRPRSVPSIHVPSPAVPKLTMAKCRRNVENFLEACRKIGVPQERLCLPLHILEEKGLAQVAETVQALLEWAPPKQQHHLGAA